MLNPKIAAFTAAALLGANMMIGSAAAMPLNGLPGASIAANVQDVRWVCSPYHCWWRPGPYWRYHHWGWWGWHHHWS
jgi:hypothetical protein